MNVMINIQYLCILKGSFLLSLNVVWKSAFLLMKSISQWSIDLEICRSSSVHTQGLPQAMAYLNVLAKADFHF
jgi:hypothetical protein